MNGLLETAASNCAVALVLAAGVSLISRLRVNPNVIHILWLMVLVKFLTPPLITVDFSWPKPHAEPAVEEVVIASEPLVLVPADSPVPVSVPMSNPSWTWSEVLLAVWGAGILGVACLTVFRIVCFRRLLAKAEPAPEELELLAAALSQKLGLRRAPTIWLLPVRITPAVWSLFGKPRIVLPRELADEMCPEQLETILAHELAHVRRGDHLVRLLELAVTTVFWWNPVVWWVRRNLREMEEQCCDALVLETLPDSARRYAIALIETVEFLSKHPGRLPIGATAARPTVTLTRRIQMLKHGSPVRRLSRRGLAGVLALLIVPMTLAFAEDHKPDSTELITKVYRLRNLDVQKAQKELREQIAPQDWAQAGGPHTMKRTKNGSLVITASREVHEQVELVLALRLLEQQEAELLKKLKAKGFQGNEEAHIAAAKPITIKIWGIGQYSLNGKRLSKDGLKTRLNKLAPVHVVIVPDGQLPAGMVQETIMETVKMCQEFGVQKITLKADRDDGAPNQGATLEYLKNTLLGEVQKKLKANRDIELVIHFGYARNTEGSRAGTGEPLLFHAGTSLPLSRCQNLLYYLMKCYNDFGLAPEKDVTVIIRAHSDVPTDQVTELIRKCQEVGFQKFAFQAWEQKADKTKSGKATERRPLSGDISKARPSSDVVWWLSGGQLYKRVLLVENEKEANVERKDGWLIVPVETPDGVLRLYIEDSKEDGRDKEADKQKDPRKLPPAAGSRRKAAE